MTTQTTKPARRKSLFSEVLTLINKHTTRHGPLYPMLGKNQKGDVKEMGVYNGTTKRYAIYRSDDLSDAAIADIKEVLQVS